MENIEKCECVIGVLWNYENTKLATLEELKKHIKDEQNKRKYSSHFVVYHNEVYSLADYCDKRKSTDLTRFNYCPLCGKKIDWKAIKGGANG